MRRLEGPTSWSTIVAGLNRNPGDKATRIGRVLRVNDMIT